MGFFDDLLYVKAEKKNLGVCVPEHVQKKIDAEAKGAVSSEKQKRIEEGRKQDEEERRRRIANAGQNSFEVDGIYSVEDTLMVKGLVLDGIVKKGAKLKSKDREVKVKEIQFSGKRANSLHSGQKGALFLAGKRFPVIRIDDIIEFE